MPFISEKYGPEVTRILALDGNGLRPMPLAINGAGPDHVRDALRACSARTLFPRGRCPEGALAGLWLYFSFFDEAHGIAQDIPSREGSYWHAMLHRQEPDPENAAYWFRRVGAHDIFASLNSAAQEIVAATTAGDLGFRPGPIWDPFVFIDFCEHARRRPGSAAEQTALAIQQAEWQLLFGYCADAAEPGRDL